MATGSFNLDLECKNADDESAHCTLKSKATSPALQVNTVPGSPRLAANASCEENAKVYQSWQLENWRRQYKLTPGDPVTPPSVDSGPSFTLRNLANGGVFECTPGKKTDGGSFDGTCTQAAVTRAAANTNASFRFDPVLDMLVVTQRWECGAEYASLAINNIRQRSCLCVCLLTTTSYNRSSFVASGDGFIQATCSRQGDMLTCSSYPLWIGTKTV